MNSQQVRTRRVPSSADRQIRQRHAQRQRKKRRQRIAGRSILLIVLVCVLLFVILFLTPIFNIKNVYVEGNNRIGSESLDTFLSDIRGENIFKVSSSDIEKRLSQIAYVDSTVLNKDYFPANITITITEKEPCAYYESGDTYSIIDSECSVLEERSDVPEGIPQLVAYTDSVTDIFDDEEAVSEVQKFLEIEKRIGLSESITEIKLAEDNQIEFVYEGRLDVICGSGLEMEQKLRFFKAAVKNASFVNAHGTMDISTTGNALYSP